MRIALLTIWRAHNYGAVLQAYATQKVLREMGHEVSFVDLRIKIPEPDTWKSRVGRLVRDAMPAHLRFRAFWRRQFPRRTPHYADAEALRALPPEADIYMVGSDQVWNVSLTRPNVLSWFLDFGPASVRRVAYASSIGTREWRGDEVLTREVRRLLSRFDAVSCREQSAADLLGATFGVKARCCLDPTLLLDDYAPLMGAVRPRRQLTFYPLLDSPQLTSFAFRLGREMGLRTVNANREIRLTRSIPLLRPTVGQWLRAIAEAEFVVTPSFHGLAFSLIFRRPFLVVNQGGVAARSVRMTDLLSRLGLMDRYFEDVETAWRSRLWERPVDWEAVYKRLSRFRRESLDFLREALAEGR